ncbi:MAG: M61 family peptidase, partial [bacterium]
IGATAWLGVITRVDGRLLVSRILRGTPAYDADLATDDELIAIDDFRLGRDGLDGRLAQYHPGDKVTLLISRRDQLRRREITLGAAPARGARLEIRPDVSAEQTTRLEAWLGKS